MDILSFIAFGDDFFSRGSIWYISTIAILTDDEKLIGRLQELNLSGELYIMFGDVFKVLSTDELYWLSSRPTSFYNYRH